MIYDFVNPPSSLDFTNMAKPEIKEYYRWVLENIPTRVCLLEEFINTYYGYENWKADYSIDSLNLLRKWFNFQVEFREMTEQEIAQIKSTLLFEISFDTELPTNRALSIAYDIGMYYGNLLIKNNPTLNWNIYFGSKKSVDYGHPQIFGFGKITFNPIRMLNTQLYILKDEPNDNCLIDLYNIWMEYI